MGPKAKCGSGTSQNKNNRGKAQIRNARVPKQHTNAPIHQITTANIPRESRTSAARLPRPHTPSINPIRTARTNKAKPIGIFGSGRGFPDLHSTRTRPTLIGRIKSKCVYASLCNADRTVATMVCHQRTRPPRQRRANRQHADEAFILRFRLHRRATPHQGSPPPSAHGLEFR